MNEREKERKRGHKNAFQVVPGAGVPGRSVEGGGSFWKKKKKKKRRKTKKNKKKRMKEKRNEKWIDVAMIATESTGGKERKKERKKVRK